MTAEGKIKLLLDSLVVFHRCQYQDADDLHLFKERDYHEKSMKKYKKMLNLLNEEI